jgi:hypothetical protein
VDFAEALEEEWATVDPDNWVVEPGSWHDLSVELEPHDLSSAIKSHVRQLTDALFSAGLLREVASRPQPTTEVVELAETFHRLAEEWRQETLIDSSIQRRVMHPAYQRIIGLGRPAVPLILAELERRPDYWFWALTAITGDDPAREETTLQGAQERWLEWAREKGM